MPGTSPMDERRYLEAIDRRMGYLKANLASSADYPGRSYDGALLKALEWITGEVRALRQQVDELQDEVDWLEDNPPVTPATTVVDDKLET